MKLIILFFSLSSFALEVGDLILQPLHCSLCSAIEQETDSIYSHIGIIIQKKPLLVAEAFEKVRIVSIKEFLNLKPFISANDAISFVSVLIITVIDSLVAFTGSKSSSEASNVICPFLSIYFDCAAIEPIAVNTNTSKNKLDNFFSVLIVMVIY